MEDPMAHLKGREVSIYYDDAAYKDEGWLERVSDQWVVLRRTTLKGDEIVCVPIHAVRMMKISGD